MGIAGEPPDHGGKMDADPATGAPTFPLCGQVLSTGKHVLVLLIEKILSMEELTRFN